MADTLVMIKRIKELAPLTYCTDPEALRHALGGITQISSGYLVKELK